jgi:hypothetical protein
MHYKKINRTAGILRMKRIFIFSAILLISLGLIATALVAHNTLVNPNQAPKPFYVGVSFCGNTTAEAELLIDRVKTYTNLFVLQSGPISKNETAINEICDYAVAAGLHIIIYFGWFDPGCPWQIPWLDLAEQRWGDQFLGVYYYDEPGGIQLDFPWSHFFYYLAYVNSTIYRQKASAMDAFMNGSLAKDYDLAAKFFVDAIKDDTGIQELKNRSITILTSDYALYWFDYLGGYDVVLAQFGWNQSIVQNIALVRGAANMQNKDWGAIITWKYTESPYLDRGEEIYKQMRMAYEAGAKYVMIFNYPKINYNPYGILFDEHFEALERFWNEVVRNPKVIPGSIKAEAALVLPENYGCACARAEVRIWYWGSDELSLQIQDLSSKLLSQYSLRLDIVYNDSSYPVAGKYPQIYYWNQTICIQNLESRT